MKEKSRLAPAFYCSNSGYFTSFLCRQPAQQQARMPLQARQRERRQALQQELQFQPIFGRKQTMPEPAEWQQARYVSFWFFLGKLS
jgi:hypothetical protein